MIRELDGAEHTQTLTIPLLDLGTARPAKKKKRGLLSALTGEVDTPAAPSGCDPAVFADEVANYLLQAEHARTEAALTRERRAKKPKRKKRDVTEDASQPTAAASGIERLLGVGHATRRARAGCGGDACASSTPPSRSCTPSRSRRARPPTRRSPQGHRAGTTRGVPRRRRTPTSTTTSFPDPIPSSRRRQRRSKRCWTGRRTRRPPTISPRRRSIAPSSSSQPPSRLTNRPPCPRRHRPRYARSSSRRTP